MRKISDFALLIKKAGGNSNLNYDEILSDLLKLKSKYVQDNKEAAAKQLWIFEQIFKIHKEYLNIFRLLKERKYHKAWQELEQLEILVISLRKHFSIESTSPLGFIDKALVNYQAIFPYKLFSSVEIFEKELKCSVCN